eukprot:scaffold17459_cov54-Attheya_sp.AAC.8
MEEDDTNALLPRNSAIAISFFYCTVNHAMERRSSLTAAFNTHKGRVMCRNSFLNAAYKGLNKSL